MPTILLKKSDTASAVPTTANLTNLAGGVEVAVNTADKRMFTMNSSSAVVEIGTNPSSLTTSDASLTVARIGSATIGNLVATSLSVTLGVGSGGTGLTSTPTNGQLLIGNGTGYTLATLTAGTGLSVTNATGSITIAASGGGLPTVTVTASTAITAAANFHYILTAASAATVTLPASPTISDTIYVTVANGLTTNVIARNGKPIQGLSEDMTLNSAYASAQLRFTDNTEGWVMA
jgi:hypothetical protein